MTRRTLARIADLIRRADAFADLASEVQNEAEKGREGLLRQLANDYGVWYAEAWAGAHPRLDFLLKDERIAIETKMTRSNLGPRRLGDELAQDILRYRKHDHADAYFALVYDPEKHIINASGFERDFPAEAAFPVRVVIIQ